MSPLEYSRKRLVAFLEEIRGLRGLEFPYSHSQEALERIEEHFKIHSALLNSLSSQSSSSTVVSACTSTLTDLFYYLPLLGFILRSTDVRNGFEVHGPLLRLSRKVLGAETRLIVSSEWDYSPLTCFNIPSLKDFVLIGFPAPESANPLLLPLAGHELGHSAWSKNSLNRKFCGNIINKILSDITERWEDFSGFFPEIAKEDLNTVLFALNTWYPAYEWAIRQSEESFCDFIAIRIFGESYLHAFAYLLSPNREEQRSVFYPNTRRRVSDFITASEEYKTAVPEGYEEMFQDFPMPPNPDPKTQFLLSVADSGSASIVADLISTAGELVSSASIEKMCPNKVHSIEKHLREFIIPPKNPESLSNIVNAAWRAFHDNELWEDHPEIESKDLVLKELVLKGIEVLEFEQRTSEAV